MFMLSHRQTSYPQHWPLHVAGMHGLDAHHTVASAETNPGSLRAASGPFDGGGLAALPWLGLHYAAEDV